MAKGQITDQELATGLKSFGGFGALGEGAAKPRREDPFRDTRAEAAETPPARVEPPRIEIVKTPSEVSAVDARVVAPSLPQEQPAPLKLKKAPPLSRPVKVQRGGESKIIPRKESVATENKTELYTERVTVPLDAELRDGAESLAKELNRRRTEKGERITANTVMRVALRMMLETFDVDAVETVNSEQELFERISGKAKQRSGKGSSVD